MTQTSLRPDGPTPSKIEPVDSKARTVKSAERTLALFELFSIHRRPMTVGEIGKMLSIPGPSATMLIQNLVRLGYLDRDRTTRKLIPTVRVPMLGGWMDQRVNSQGNLERHLERLAQTVQHTCCIGIENGLNMQYVLAQMAGYPHFSNVLAGMLLPLPRTATGRALLSRHTDEQIAFILRRYNAAAEPDYLYPVETFMPLIEQIREQGHAEADGAMRPGFMAFSMAVDINLGQIPIAVSVGGPTEGLLPQKKPILEALARFKRDVESARNL